MIETDKFHVVDSLDGHKTITIRSDYIDDCMEYYNQHEDIDGVYICPMLGYKLKDISFLQQHKYVTGVEISDAERIDLSGIENLKELEYISILGSTQPIDYSAFPKLEQIQSTWHPKVELSESKNLKHLCFWHYKPQRKNLMELPNLPNLGYLGMIQSSIESTKGIGRYKKLTNINLAYLPKMTLLCDMENLPIEIAEFTNCKQIHNLDYVGNIKTLKRLICSSCSPFRSIGFLKKLKYLEHFAFMDVDVLDGDMSPCLSVPYTAFTDKKHFSHTMKQIDKLKSNLHKKLTSKSD